MNIIITGSGGQLGTECVRALADRHGVLGLTRDQLDITDAAAVASVLTAYRPRAVVNCAAFTRVDDCEGRARTADEVNVRGPQNLARAAEKIGARLIHFSTDYVFDGAKTVPRAYVESDPGRPLSAYGRSKLSGEQAIAMNAKRYAIVRTAWLYAIGGNNFLKTVLRLALRDPVNPLRVVDDQFGSPTYARRLALQVRCLLDEDAAGIYHASAEGYCSWHQLAGYFLNKMKVPFELAPCPSSEYPTAARRPMNAILENARLKAEGLNLMVDWREDVDGFVAAYRERLIAECTNDRG